MSDTTTYFVSTAIVFLIIFGIMFLCNGLRVLSPHNRVKRRVDRRNVNPTIFVMRRAPPVSVRNNNEAHRVDVPNFFTETPQIHAHAPPPSYLESNGASIDMANCPPPSYLEATRINVY